MSVRNRLQGNTQTTRTGYGGDGTQSVVVDESQLDAFGRTRSGSPYGLLDSKLTYTKDNGYWQEDTGGGGSSTYVGNESSVALDVGTADGDYVIRQTYKPYGYAPGKSVHILMTGVMDVGKANLIQRIGYYDDDNGLFFELNGTDLRVVIRSSTSGSVVDTPVSQTDWNLDVLDNGIPAKNPTGVNLDITKAQIFMIDFQWLGTGRVRFGFVIDGQHIWVHEILNANVVDKVYMTTPDLPARYEVRNNGTTTSASSLKEICTSISSDGGYALPGYPHSEGNGITTRSVGARTPIFAIRQEATHQGKTNKRFAEFLKASFYSDSNTYFEVYHYRNVAAVTATWTSMAEDDSSVEYSRDITSVTGEGHRIGAEYVTAATGTSKAEVSRIEKITRDKHNFIARNMLNDNSDYFVVFATPFAGTDVVACILSWMEFD